MNGEVVSSVSVPSRQSKMIYLDGLRGLMAINVILCHFVCVYYPQMYFLEFAREKGGVLSWFATSPLSVLINGDIAVRYFFVLTGFLVAMSVFQKDMSRETLVKKSALRYTRLLPVILLATLFTYLTMVLGAQYHLNILDRVANPDFLAGYCNFVPTIPNLIWNIFINPFQMSSAYIGPFWTIRYEFWGYILSMLICYFLKNSKWRRIGYFLLAAIVFLQFSSDYIAFILGIFVADLLFNEHPTILSKYYTHVLSHKWFIRACVVVSLYFAFAACPINFTSIYKIWGYIPGNNTDIMRSVGISLFLFVFLKSNFLKKLFAWKPFEWLGHISYEIYALHWPLMLSLQAFLFSVFIQRMHYDVAACLAFLITLPVILAGAILLSRVVQVINKGVKGCISHMQQKKYGNQA